METGLWIALAGVTLTGLGFVVGLIRWSVAELNSVRKEAERKLAEAIKTGDEKRARIYERVDEIKKCHKEEVDSLRTKIAQEYTQLAMCKIIHTNNDNNFNRLESKVDVLGQKLDEVLKLR